MDDEGVMRSGLTKSITMRYGGGGGIQNNEKWCYVSNV